jgi:hypothetical protein
VPLVNIAKKARIIFLRRVILFAKWLLLVQPRLSLSRVPKSILIDNSVLAHSVIEETYWVSTNTATPATGGLGTGYLTSIPIYSRENESRNHLEAQYVATLCDLIRKGYLQAISSCEMELERIRQPWGRFFGYAIFDTSLFSELPLRSIDGYGFRPLETLNEQATRIDATSCLIYNSLMPFFSSKDNLDVYHLATAERNNLDAYVSFDFKFIGKFNEAEKRNGFPKLRVRPMPPSGFAKMIGALPFPLVVLRLLKEDPRWEMLQSSPNQKRESRRRK